MIPPGYKQTEVGVIPEEWEVKTLNSLSTISRLAGAEYTSVWKETPNGEIIALRGFNIGQGKIIERDFVHISNRLSLKLKRSRLCKGDVVYPCVGSIGNAAVINEDAKYHIQQNIARITPDSTAISSDYLADYLMSSLAEQEVDRFTSSSSQPSVLVGSLRQYRIPLPPTMAEQRAIATALSDVDALLAALDRLIAKQRDLKQAAMQQLLTGQTRLPGFTGKWETKLLGEVGTCIRGVSYQGDSDLSSHDTASTKRLLRSNNVQDSTIVISDVQFVNAARVSEKQILLKDDILICMANGSKALVGKAGLFSLDDGYPYTFGAFMGCFRNNSDAANSAFVFYLFQTGRYRDYINNLLAGSSINNLSPGSIESLEFLMPPLPEQTAIATVLSDMDLELAALEQRRDKTRALKQGMMQELLTGRTRLV
jgi:type I restriction enzyme S subunit